MRDGSTEDGWTDVWWNVVDVVFVVVTYVVVVICVVFVVTVTVTVTVTVDCVFVVAVVGVAVDVVWKYIKLLLCLVRLVLFVKDIIRVIHSFIFTSKTTEARLKLL